MKTYETPKLELIRFQTEDIVTSSPGSEVEDGEQTGDITIIG